MSIEIERRFLVKFPNKFLGLESIHTRAIHQYYIGSAPGTSQRIRRSSDKGVEQCIKIPNPKGEGSIEMEFSIPNSCWEDLKAIMIGEEVVKSRIEYLADSSGKLLWELDLFGGKWTGLRIVEIELPSMDTDIGPLPEWIFKEITGINVLSNKGLACNPKSANDLLIEMGYGDIYADNNF